jgi:hypothetical protein
MKSRVTDQLYSTTCVYTVAPNETISYETQFYI